MTPRQCLETRLRLGWSRADLASACSLAAPIVRLYEAGALEGFEECQEAIEAALWKAEARPPVRACKPRASWKTGAGLAEAGASWRGQPWATGVRA